jgi:hypothetical protein
VAKSIIGISLIERNEAAAQEIQTLLEISSELPQGELLNLQAYEEKVQFFVEKLTQVRATQKAEEVGLDPALTLKLEPGEKDLCNP